MKTKSIPVLSALGLGLALSVTAIAQPDSKQYNIGEQKLVSVTATATVQAMNLETREVTFKGELGNEFSLTIDPSVKRLNEVKVGDQIVVNYNTSLAAELRAPTEEEKASPLSVTEEVVKSKGAPGVSGSRVVKALVTIEGLDRTTSSVTIKGPRGNSSTVRVKDTSVLDRLQLGDTVFIVYTEAVGLSVKKAPAKKE
jgi:hypothetical protein